MISVCIPVYNNLSGLKICLKSILDQISVEYEIIITDDSSNDEIENYIKTLDLKLNYSRNKIALGSPQNWNYAVSKAQGEYIKIMHQDDFFTQPESLNLMLQPFIINPSINLVFCACKVVDKSGNYKEDHLTPPDRVKEINKNPYSLFGYNSIGAPSTILYRCDTEIIYDQHLIWNVDYDFYIRYLNKHNGLFYLNKALVGVSHSANGITSKVENDPSIVLKEHFYLFKKYNFSLLNFTPVKYLLKEIKRFDIKSYDELIKFVQPSLVPSYIRLILRLLFKS